MKKRYDVCAPRKYKAKDGSEKIHWWQVGTAFALNNEREGISIKLYTRLLPTDELVCFLRDEEEKTEPEEPRNDDIPF